MTRFLVSLFLALSVGSVLGRQPDGGYQLKYKSIPPKAKVVELIREPAAPPKKAEVQVYFPPSASRLRAMEATRAWREERQQRYSDTMTAKVRYRAQQWENARAAYFANLERRVRLEDIYEESQAAAEGALPAAWELERRAQNHEAWLWRYERPVVVESRE